MTSQLIFPESEWKKIKAAGLPDEVVFYIECYSHEDEKKDLIRKLVSTTPEVIKMWQTYERWRLETDTDEFCVSSLLGRIQWAYKRPAFHYKTPKERTELLEKIEKHSKQLINLVKSSDLDIHIIYTPAGIFKGFTCYEDYSESNQWAIDSENVDKLLFSNMLKSFIERSEKELNAPMVEAKNSKNMAAIKFVRTLADGNKRRYGVALNTAVATATNALFDTKYTAVSIANLLNR
ncbi:hypothetical protein [Solemya velum gill symbiont]|uniref:hypothetical protein n=1 Tax=Solemya velum gill symbiont TaxID=2340 RepID=UPI00099822E4|nr:hypothetical protein [Solemya velum gill symbiont]OOY36508.1 hypothetical protein BOV89_12215 [Solemya velum gill symbiont]OOY42444.1 hypothetical protein BOV92_13570 [Solemya velum gill symbiont]